MKKSKIKREVKEAMKIYYESGLTMTGGKVQDEILKRIDRLYDKKHRK